MNNLQITVQIKSVYGSQKIYPICDKANLFCKMTDTKTLTQDSINCIKALGYTINVQQDAVTL